MNYFEIIKNGLIIKGVKKWYFGLETALKLNNMTNEYFTIDYVVNDSIFRVFENFNACKLNLRGYTIIGIQMPFY